MMTQAEGAGTTSHDDASDEALQVGYVSAKQRQHASKGPPVGLTTRQTAIAVRGELARVLGEARRACAHPDGANQLRADLKRVASELASLASVSAKGAKP